MSPALNFLLICSFRTACQDRFHLISSLSPSLSQAMEMERQLIHLSDKQTKNPLNTVFLTNSPSGTHTRTFRLAHSCTHSITLSKSDFKVFNLSFDFLCFAGSSKKGGKFIVKRIEEFSSSKAQTHMAKLLRPA